VPDRRDHVITFFVPHTCIFEFRVKTGAVYIDASLSVQLDSQRAEYLITSTILGYSSKIDRMLWPANYTLSLTFVNMGDFPEEDGIKFRQHEAEQINANPEEFDMSFKLYPRNTKHRRPHSPELGPTAPQQVPPPQQAVPPTAPQQAGA